jgi:hypothetical protein
MKDFMKVREAEGEASGPLRDWWADNDIGHCPQCAPTVDVEITERFGAKGSTSVRAERAKDDVGYIGTIVAPFVGTLISAETALHMLVFRCAFCGHVMLYDASRVDALKEA